MAVILLPHASILPQLVQRLELLDHVLAARNKLLDLVGVAHVFVLQEGGVAALAEELLTFWVLATHENELQKIGKWIEQTPHKVM